MSFALQRIGADARVNGRLSECGSTGCVAPATDCPQQFKAAIKFHPIVRIERKAKHQRGNENSNKRKHAHESPLRRWLASR